MATKSLVIAAVGTIAALSIGAGSYLAFRADNGPATVAAAPMADSRPRAQAVESSPASAPLPSSSNRSQTASSTTTRKEVSRTPVAPADAPAAARRTPARGATPSPQESVPAPVVAIAAAVTPPVEPPPPPVSTPPIEAPVIQEPVKTKYDELTVKEDAVIGIRIDETVTSETAQVEDRVTARVSRDVTVQGRTAIPSGARLEGVVTLVERGGKLRERAKLGIRFNTLILADGLRVPIQTDTIFREGEGPAGEASSKIGASAVVGAILGAVIGGKRGAVIGSTAGAAGGTAAVMAGSRNEAAFTSGAPLTLRLTTPVTVLIERDLTLR